MSFLSNLIFGKKVYINDPVIGKLDARIRSKNPSVGYTWSSSHLLPNQKDKTVFILEGNVNGPTQKHLESAYRIVNEIDSIIEKIDFELSKDQSVHVEFKDWRKHFYFAALTPYEVERANNFEINFEPNDSNDTRYVGCIWYDGKISEVEAKL